MSVRINTNIEALGAQRNLNATAATFAKSVEKLSSGLRINRAADDSAGLAISEKLKAQVTGLNQAQRNAQDGVSMVQTAEGALTEVHSMLQRIRELAVEAANSSLSSSDAKSVGTEIAALRDEIDRIGNSTTFNGQYLLTGSMSVSQDTGTAGSLLVGTALSTGHAASVAAIDTSGAKASTTYTITSQAGGKVTLSDGLGNSQQVTMAATIGATGTMSLNFSQMGVKLTIVGAAAKTSAEIATDLAAVGAPVTKAIGGVAGSDLVNGDTLTQADTTPVSAGASVTYNPGLGGLDDSGGLTPLTATASAGVALGAASIYWVNLVTGVIHMQAGSEDFVGTIPAPVDGASASMILAGDQGHSITLTYTQGTGANIAQVVSDMFSADFTFTAGTAAASVSTMAVAPTTAAGTYTFTSSGAGSLTLTGPGGTETIAVADMAANSSQTLDFATLGISFDIDTDGTVGGLSASNIIGNLLLAANDTIVVTSSGGGGTNNVIATGVNAGANFQIGATGNAVDALSVTFADARVTNNTAVGGAGYGALNADINAFVAATGTGTGIVAAAQTLINSVDTGIGFVSTVRGNLGAVQNRLEHTTASISVASENLNASMSRIKDLDVASEMVNFTKTQILQQAGTAILAQANSAPQNILTLLR